MFRFLYDFLTETLQRDFELLIEFFQGLSEIFEWVLHLDWSYRLMDGSSGFFHGVSDIFEWFLMTIENDLDRPLWITIFMLPILVPYWIGGALYAAVSHPFSLLHLESKRLRNLYLGIPSLVLMFLTIIAGIHTSTSSKSIDDRYRISMQQALASGDFKLASILGGRLVSDRNEVDQEARFDYAVALRRSGDHARSDAVLTSLAPADHPGYQPAHRLRAQILAEQLKGGSGEAILEELRWHLENSGDSPNLITEQLWTGYFVTIGQPEDAITHLELAAKVEPRLLIPLANLHAQTKNKSGETRALREAEDQFRRRLRDNPLSHDFYVQLAIAQARLNKPDEAEETILKGVKLLNDAKMRRAAADYYLFRYDTSARENATEFAVQFGYLEKALIQDPFFADVFLRLISLSEKAKQHDEATKALNLLKTMLSEGNSPALTHFALSGIYQGLGDIDKSEFHLFQSYRLDSQFPLVTNNLAWTLAHAQQPDLSRACELVKNALRADPNNHRFHDTYATILMKQDKVHDAIAEFEAILSKAPDRIRIHRMLVELYGRLQIQDMAIMHSEKANELSRLVAKKAN